jgi:hypothetical protein
MVQKIYKEQDLPMGDLGQIGLAENGRLVLDESDLQALLSGSRTGMLKLQNITADGVNIDSLDAKLSLRQNDRGSLDLLVHPVYREASYPEYLTDSEAESLEKGAEVNLEKIINDHGVKKEMLVEFDKETREFIITDTEKVLVPDMVNNEYLSLEQKERYRKGKEVELSDGTRFQYAGGDARGVRANKLALIASVIVDGGMSYLLYKGLNAMFGQKHEPQKADVYSKGYYQALEDMIKKNETEKPANRRNESEQSRAYTRSGYSR